MSDVKPATDEERARWAEDARLGFVRPSKGPDYIRDTTIVSKVLALNARIDDADKRIAALELFAADNFDPTGYEPGDSDYDLWQECHRKCYPENYDD